MAVEKCEIAAHDFDVEERFADEVHYPLNKYQSRPAKHTDYFAAHRVPQFNAQDGYSVIYEPSEMPLGNWFPKY